MEEAFLYRQIAGHIRLAILEGRLKPGERLPSIREMTRTWACTQGTIQRAYQELAQQGLVVSRAGKGTLVAGRIDRQLMQTQGPLRRASLVHQAEAFLLEMLTAGFALSEIQQSIELAVDRWRALQAETSVPVERVIRFAGSHDPAVSWLANQMPEIHPGTELQITFNGSLGGLMSLASGLADVAGCHLWDADTKSYNLAFIRKMFPNQKMAAVRLADRRLGWIVAPGNPHQISRLEDIAQPGLRFVNRQGGSGTRVWLDGALQHANLDGKKIVGYGDEKATHSDVARLVAEGKADLGLGLEASAAAFQLDFVFLVEEAYDLVLPAAGLDHPPLQSLVTWLASKSARQRLGEMVGYSADRSGMLQWI